MRLEVKYFEMHNGVVYYKIWNSECYNDIEIARQMGMTFREYKKCMVETYNGRCDIYIAALFEKKQDAEKALEEFVMPRLIMNRVIG